MARREQMKAPYSGTMPATLRRRAFGLAVIMALVVALVRLGLAESRGYGPADVIRFGEQPYGVDLPQNTPPFFLMWSRGDGQAFMSIAADLDGDGASAGLGRQAYRMSRIGHSVVARGLSFGQIDLLPFGLASASFLAYGCLLAAAVRLTDQLGYRAMLLGLTPAAIIGTTYDTAEGFGSLLLVVGLTSTSLSSGIAAGALLGVTRPSFGTGILASRHGAIVPVATIAAAIALQAWLALDLGVGFSGFGGNFVMPFTGFVAELPRMTWPVFTSAAIVVVIAAILVRHAFDVRFTPGFRLAGAVTAIIAISVGPATFVEPGSPLRVSGAAFVLLVLAPLFDRTDRVKDDSNSRNGAAWRA